MSDLISRAEAMDASEKFIKDCNPDHFVGHQKFIEYMDNAEIGSFGKWQFANGFNMGLTAAEVAIKKLPSAQPELIRCKDCKYCRTYYHGENMPFTYACDKLYLTNNLSSDDYCSRAERKEE